MKTSQTPLCITSVLKYIITLIPEKVVIAYQKLFNPYTVAVIFLLLLTRLLKNDYLHTRESYCFPHRFSRSLTLIENTLAIKVNLKVKDLLQSPY